MNRSQQIRQWFADNPGRHFMSDVRDGMAAEGKDRKLAAQSICKLAMRKHLVAEGSRNFKRYSLGRPVRAYKIKGDSND